MIQTAFVCCALLIALVFASGNKNNDAKEDWFKARMNTHRADDKALEQDEGHEEIEEIWTRETDEKGQSQSPQFWGVSGVSDLISEFRGWQTRGLLASTCWTLRADVFRTELNLLRAVSDATVHSFVRCSNQNFKLAFSRRSEGKQKLCLSSPQCLFHFENPEDGNNWVVKRWTDEVKAETFGLQPKYTNNAKRRRQRAAPFVESVPRIYCQLEWTSTPQTKTPLASLYRIDIHGDVIVGSHGLHNRGEQLWNAKNGAPINFEPFACECYDAGRHFYEVGKVKRHGDIIYVNACQRTQKPYKTTAGVFAFAAGDLKKPVFMRHCPRSQGEFDIGSNGVLAMATMSRNSEIYIEFFDTKMQSVTQTIYCNDCGPVFDLTLSPDSERLAVVSGNGVLVFDAISGEQIGETRQGKYGTVSICWLNDDMFVTADGKGIEVWHRENPEPLRSFRCHSSVPSLVRTSDDSFVIPVSNKC